MQHVSNYFKEKKIVDLKFRGSTNQRKIDIKASLESGNTVQLKFGDEARYEKKSYSLRRNMQNS